MNVEDKVTYISHNKIQIGIVKSIPDNSHAFVVYHCNNDWDNYFKYTAARTNIDDLILGWPDDTTIPCNHLFQGNDCLCHKCGKYFPETNN